MSLRPRAAGAARRGPARDSRNSVKLPRRLSLLQAVSLNMSMMVGVGPFLFTLIGPDLHCLDSSESLRLEARAVHQNRARALVGALSRSIEDENIRRTFLEGATAQLSGGGAG